MKLTTTTLIATLMATGVSTAAMAQTSVDGAVGDTAQENYGQLIQELRAGAETDTQTQAEIDAFDADAKLDVVTVSELKASKQGTTTALDDALDAQAEAVDDMRASVDANADLSAELEAEGFTSEEVVAVRGNGMGGLTLIVDDRG